MDKTTVLGMILGLLAIGTGLVLKGVSLLALFNPAAFLIIFVGTASALFIAFSTQTIKKIPALIKIIFQEDKQSKDKQMIISQLIDWSIKSRKEVILTLESEIAKITNPILQ